MCKSFCTSPRYRNTSSASRRGMREFRLWRIFARLPSLLFGAYRLWRYIAWRGEGRYNQNNKGVMHRAYPERQTSTGICLAMRGLHRRRRGNVSNPWRENSDLPDKQFKDMICKTCTRARFDECTGPQHRKKKKQDLCPAFLCW